MSPTPSGAARCSRASTCSAPARLQSSNCARDPCGAFRWGTAASRAHSTWAGQARRLRKAGVSLSTPDTTFLRKRGGQRVVPEYRLLPCRKIARIAACAIRWCFQVIRAFSHSFGRLTVRLGPSLPNIPASKCSRVRQIAKCRSLLQVSGCRSYGFCHFEGPASARPG
jgi:hypothetical protein